MPRTKAKPRVRPRKFVMIELTDTERAKLDALKAAHGERATLASVVRKLIMEAEID